PFAALNGLQQERVVPSRRLEICGHGGLEVGDHLAVDRDHVPVALSRDLQYLVQRRLQHVCTLATELRRSAGTGTWYLPPRALSSPSRKDGSEGREARAVTGTSPGSSSRGRRAPSPSSPGQRRGPALC